jgi:hypothetical protein
VYARRCWISHRQCRVCFYSWHFPGQSLTESILRVFLGGRINTAISGNWEYCLKKIRQQSSNMWTFFFHIRTVHLDIIKVFYSPTDAKWIVLKKFKIFILKNNFKIFIHQLIHKWIVLKTILKFLLKLTLKQLLQVSVQSPLSGGVLLELAKFTVVKIIN